MEELKKKFQDERKELTGFCKTELKNGNVFGSVQFSGQIHTLNKMIELIEVLQNEK